MQAIHRKTTDDGAKGYKTRLTRPQMDALDFAVHEFQRVRLESEVMDFTDNFHAALRKLCMHPPTAAAKNTTTQAPSGAPSNDGAGAGSTDDSQGASPVEEGYESDDDDDDDDDYEQYADVREEVAMTKEEKLAFRKYKSLKEYFDKYWLVPFWLRKLSVQGAIPIHADRVANVSFLDRSWSPRGSDERRPEQCQQLRGSGLEGL